MKHRDCSVRNHDPDEAKYNVYINVLKYSKIAVLCFTTQGCMQRSSPRCLMGSVLLSDNIAADSNKKFFGWPQLRRVCKRSED